MNIIMDKCYMMILNRLSTIAVIGFICLLGLNSFTVSAALNDESNINTSEQIRSKMNASNCSMEVEQSGSHPSKTISSSGEFFDKLANETSMQVWLYLDPMSAVEAGKVCKNFQILTRWLMNLHKEVSERGNERALRWCCLAYAQGGNLNVKDIAHKAFLSGSEYATLMLFDKFEDENESNIRQYFKDQALIPEEICRPIAKSNIEILVLGEAANPDREAIPSSIIESIKYLSEVPVQDREAFVKLWQVIVGARKKQFPATLFTIRCLSSMSSHKKRESYIKFCLTEEDDYLTPTLDDTEDSDIEEEIYIVACNF